MGNKIPGTLNISKLPSLDGLRGISIGFVILSHLFYTTKFDEASLGGIGVEMFFVISGFLITSLLLKEKCLKSKISLKNFYIRRALRILPVVFLFLFTLFFLNIIFHLQISNLSFLTSIFFLKNLPIPGGGDWYTGHFWSLAVEEQFYLIFPFLISYLSLKRYKQLVISLIIILPTISFCFFGKIGLFYSNNTIHYITRIIVNVFGVGTALILVGSYLSVLIFENSKVIEWVSSLKYYLLSFALFLIALFIRIPTFNLFIPYFSRIFFAFIIGITIILNLDNNNLMSKVLNLKYIALVGVLSYSLYIWQQIFTHNLPWGNMFKYADYKVLNLFILFFVAYISYNFYEKKFLDFKRRFKIVE